MISLELEMLLRNVTALLSFASPSPKGALDGALRGVSTIPFNPGMK